MATAEKFIGSTVLRKEDPELLTGQAKYTDDIAFPGMLWMHVVRSPFAHAKINGVDLSKALAMPGVVAAFSGQDLAGDWTGPLLMAWAVTEDIHNPPHWPLTKDKARFQGDGVAVVVGETREQAADAAEVVDVDYDELPAVVDMNVALADGARSVHDEFGTNKCYTWNLSNGDVDKVFGEAPVVVKVHNVIQRQIPTAIEPRSVLAQPNPAQGDFTLFSATQIPHIVKVAMTLGLGIPESKLRVVAPAVGGGFGSKLQVYPEEMLSLALAKRLGRPIKWTETRSENYLATHHGRDQIQEMELAADNEGRIIGYRARILVNMGAYLMVITPGTPLLGAFVYCGPYGGDAYQVEFTGVFTNTTPTDAYRGAGRPEATYAIERAVDALARKVGKDRLEIRRLNFLAPFTEPTPSPGGLTLDSGNYHETLDKALELMGNEDLRKEQQIRREQGDTRQIGIGFSTYLEMCGLAPSRVLKSLNYAAGGWDAASIRVSPTGKVVVAAGTSPHGQGHATTFAQIVADDLGIPIDDIEVGFGDTELSPLGMDTYGSRSISVGGVAVHRAAEKVVAKARKIAAHELEVAEEDLDYDGGTFTVKGAPDKAKSIPEIAFAAWTAHNLPDGLEPSLEATAAYDPQNFVFPYGAHICAVEVDTETGQVNILKYVAVDDVGRIINPDIVDGQVVGGVIQGIAEALFEEAIYDQTGNLTTSTLTNYEVPAASDLPPITIGRAETPSTTNELGVKGVGETGTIASPPAVINAVIDALSHLGITDMERPATPERVWRAIQRAKAEGPPGARRSAGPGAAPTSGGGSA
ncbi:MAG TPA: xanthine dehydrogenase family protein molybdopterin-binding subunit [Actinomycetota bacterium]|jgi:carbon-monoxide dehydrogenase large subunit|nr:xanthine dehydrogenase family protein molybdopterin-binding subunit [Actinomycetota bacterium]